MSDRAIAIQQAATPAQLSALLPSNLRPAFEAPYPTYDLVKEVQDDLFQLGNDVVEVFRHPLFRNHTSYSLRTALQAWVLETVNSRDVKEAAALMDGQHTPALVAKLTEDKGWQALGNVLPNSDYPHKESLVFVMWDTARRDEHRKIPEDLLASAYYLLGWHQPLMKHRLKFMLDGRRCGFEACSDASRVLATTKPYNKLVPQQYLTNLAWHIRERKHTPHVLAMLAKNVSSRSFPDPFYFINENYPDLVNDVQKAILETRGDEWCTTELMQEGALLGGEHTVDMFDRLVRRGDWAEVKEVLYRSSDHWRMKCAKQLIERGWKTVHKASTIPPDVFKAALLSLPQLSVGSRRQIHKLLRIALDRSE